jgi:hypothetical protein
MSRLLFVALMGCASAGPPQFGEHSDGGINRPDGIVNVDAFVSHVDAPPGQQTKTLSETTSQTIAAGSGIGCNDPSGFGTDATNYYRVFDLATFQITTDFHVTMISFQVDESIAMGNGAVRVGTYAGTPAQTLTPGSMTVLASSATVSLPDTQTGMINAPIAATIPAGSKMFIEVDVPDGQFLGDFYMGVNAGGEMGLGYLSATGCSVNTPTSVTQLLGAETDLLMTVTGTY